MKPKLKPLNQQVVVITGASSGIGLVTARMAAQRGAKLVLASRNTGALEQLAAEIRQAGGEALAIGCDVGDEAQVRAVADAAIAQFGGFDTWVNNAGVSIFGELDQVPLAEMRRLFDTNFWGVVHGSLVACETLRARGGALVNVGSEVSDVAVPLQTIYSASKAAVKNFTDGLRLELQRAQAPVSVTLVKPAAIDTMFVPHARNHMDVEPSLPAPIYAPEVAAKAILHGAEHVVRDVYAGGGAKFTIAAARALPGALDRLMRGPMWDQQRTGRPARAARLDAFDAPRDGLRERWGSDHRVHESSWYTSATTHPKATGLVALGLGVAAVIGARHLAARRSVP